MGLFSRGNSSKQLTQLRDEEARAAKDCKNKAAQVESTGKPIYGIGSNGWRQRAETFQNAADDYQQQIDRKRRR